MPMDLVALNETVNTTLPGICPVCECPIMLYYVVFIVGVWLGAMIIVIATHPPKKREPEPEDELSEDDT